MRVDIHSLQGTVCAWVPPPPNDRLWFGFVSAPELRAEATPLLNQNVRTPCTACRCLSPPSTAPGEASQAHCGWQTPWPYFMSCCARDSQLHVTRCRFLFRNPHTKRLTQCATPQRSSNSLRS